MLLRGTAKEFPASSACDSAFTVTINLSDDVGGLVTCSEADQCKDCGAYLLQTENLCPVCFPNVFYDIRRSTNFHFFRVNTAKERPPPPAFLLLLDLDLGPDNIKTFVHHLAEKAKQTEIGSLVFYIGIIGACVSFVRSDDGKLRFCTIPVRNDTRIYAKRISDHLRYLDEALEFACELALPATNKTEPLTTLFEFLWRSGTIEDIESIVYILSGEVDSEIPYDGAAKLHLIQVSENPSRQNVEFCLQKSATFSWQKEIQPGLIDYMKQCLNSGHVTDPRMDIIVSKGLSVREFIGPVKTFSVSNNGQHISVEMKLFSDAIPVSAVLKNVKVTSGYVSMQVVIRVFAGVNYVLNDVWEVAQSPIEWVNSVDEPWFCGLLLQRKAMEFYKQMDITTPWPIPLRKVKFSKGMHTLKTMMDVLEQLVTDVAANGKIFDEHQRAYFLLHCFYNDRSFCEEVYKTVTVPNVQNWCIVFPPFLIFKEKEVPEVAQWPACGLPAIVIRSSAYDRLKKLLARARANLNQK